MMKIWVITTTVYNDDLDVLWERFGNLSCGGGWEDEDVSGGGVLGGGQGARGSVAPETLVGRELLVHHTQHRVRFH